MQALVEIDHKITEIQSKLSDLPAETISLGESVDAQSLSSTLANCINTLTKHPGDARSKADYSDYREDLNKIASKLYAVVTQALVTPAVAIGIKYALHSLALFAKFDQRFGFESASDRSKLSASSLNIIQTLEGVTGDSGLKRYVDMTRSKIIAARDITLRSPFAVVLPKNFSELTTSEGNSNGSSSDVPFCMMSSFDSTTIGVVPGRLGNVRTGDPGSPAEITTRYTRTIERINYVVTKYIAFGGRPIYNVDIPPPSTWKPDTFTRVVLHRAEYTDVVKSIDPASKVAGCTADMANVQQGSPGAFNTFITSLGDYCALVALESRFLALQESALQDLDAAKKLDATFKHG